LYTGGVSEPRQPDEEPGREPGQEPSEEPGDEQSEESERRRRVMERLAEMLQGPPPGRSGAGAVAGGGVEAAIAELGLGLAPEDTEKVAGAMAEGPDPEEAAALFRALLEGFQAWQRKPAPEDAVSEDPPPP
jgi:hypothetical protein